MGPNQKPDLGRLGPAESHRSYLFEAIRLVKKGRLPLEILMMFDDLILVPTYTWAFR